MRLIALIPALALACGASTRPPLAPTAAREAALAQPAPEPAGAPGAERVPAPQATEVRSEPNKGLLIPGTIGLYASWGTPLAIGVIYLALVYPFQAAFSDNDTPAATPLYLMIPLAGPFIVARGDWADDEPGVRKALYIDGALQIASAAIALSAFVFRSERRVPRARAWQVAPGPGLGVGLSRSF